RAAKGNQRERLGGRSPTGRRGCRTRGPLRRGRTWCAAPAARRAFVPHEGSALVAHGRRDGVEGAANGARLRAHLPHLLFLAEPVFERKEGRLFAPPVRELGLRERAAELLLSVILELPDDLVVLQAHLLLVIGHFDLARRELDA